MADIFATLRAMVGIKNYQSDSEVIPRAGSGGQLLVDGLHGAYYQAAKDGQLYHATTGGAGVALSVDVEGTTWSAALFNPAGSNIDMVVIEARLGRGTTGEIGPGTVFWVRGSKATSTVPTGTDMAVTSGRIAASAGNIGQALAVVTVEATDGVRVRVAFSLAENIITSVSEAIKTVSDKVDGQLIIPPGQYLGLTAEGEAGSSPLVHIGFSWKEVPV